MPNLPSRPAAASARRRALLALLDAAALAALPGRGPCAAEPPPIRTASLDSLQRLAPGVFALAGANAAPARSNAGAVGNLGFVVGTDAIAVIDTGSSLARAGELLAQIRKVSQLPLRVVFITHPAQEFLFGASLFIDQGVPVLADPLTPQLMAQRCQHCLETLNLDLGSERMAGTRLALPGSLELPAAPIDLGGRRLLLQPGPKGTVPGNLMVFDPSSGVLFTGALLSVGRIPGMQDARPPDWQRALKRLDDPAVRIAVPAYGAVAARDAGSGQVELAAASAALGGYFDALEAQARTLYARATPLDELAEHAVLPAYADWNGYPATHVHNIFYRYLQLEAEDLASH
jgi:glyoxylase-like metal-dependent hydrolase (beta-lactamase superfamily II)